MCKDITRSWDQLGNIRKIEDQREGFTGTGYQIAGFERLRVRQKANHSMLEIHKIAGSLPKDEKFNLKSQMERSSESVADNIAEGAGSYITTKSNVTMLKRDNFKNRHKKS